VASSWETTESLQARETEVESMLKKKIMPMVLSKRGVGTAEG